MSCAPCCNPPSCAPLNLCAPENYGSAFPTLVGPMGPPGGPGTYVETLALLRLIDATVFTAGYVAWVSTHSTAGDGGGGNFRYDPSSAAADDDGITIRPANGIGRWIRIYSGAVNVRWMGARGVGVGHDDRPAFVAALAASQSVYVPPCSVAYYLLTEITLPSGSRIFGDGYSSKVTCAAADSITIRANATTDVQIEFLYVINTGTTSGGAFGYAIGFTSGANRGICKTVRTEGKRGGVLISNSNDCLVEDHYNFYCDSATGDSAGVAIKNSSSRNTISINRLLGGGWHGVLVQTIAIADRCDDNIVNACTIADCHAYGIAFYIAVAASFAERNIATGNSIRNIIGDVSAGTFGAGIYVQGAEWSNITGNTISKTNVSTTTELLAPGAIGLANVSCATLTGNMIHDARWFGIYINDANNEGNGLGSIVISGGEISVPTKDGIKVSRANNVTITNVDITNGLASGINIVNISAKRGHVITGGTIKGCASQCVQAAYANGLIVNGVKGENYGNYGMYFDNCAGLTVDGNRLYGTAAGKVAYAVLVTCADVSFLNNSALSGGAGSIGVLADVVMVVGNGNRITGHTTLWSGVGGVERTVGASATPSLLDGDGVQYIMAASGTAITNFTDGAPNQRSVIRATGNRTINNGAGILLDGAANFAMVANNTLEIMFSVALAGWIEVARKV